MCIFTRCLCVQSFWVPVALLVHSACSRDSVGGFRGGASGRGSGLAQELGRALHIPVPGVLACVSVLVLHPSDWLLKASCVVRLRKVLSQFTTKDTRNVHLEIRPTFANWKDTPSYPSRHSVS